MPVVLQHNPHQCKSIIRLHHLHNVLYSINYFILYRRHPAIGCWRASHCPQDTGLVVDDSCGPSENRRH
jgi:hypothetical protein